MLRNTLIFTAALIATVGLLAQPPGKGKGGVKGKAKAGAVVDGIRELKPNLYMITGGGANTLVRVTDDGLILVDTKNPSDAAPMNHFDRMMEMIKSVTDKPVKYVINTQHHPDHVGNNQKFIDSGARVFAGDKLSEHMAMDPRTKDIPGRPQETFGNEKTLTLGDATVEMYFFGPGHTGGDTIVYFPKEKVVMVGDQMTDTNPIVDFANGGSAVHWNDSLNGALKLDFDTAIPGRGEPKTRAEVMAFRDKFQKLVDRARAAVKAGATEANLGEKVAVDDLGWTFRGNFWSDLYKEIK